MWLIVCPVNGRGRRRQFWDCSDMQKNGKLILIGAGPGDPELVTYKAVRKLAEADVILYDALVHPDLLNHAGEEVEKIFVGKRAGQHLTRQEMINRLIVDRIGEGQCVVRLKGGDPFIFGRGHEEIALVRDSGTEIEVVPGLSSSTSLTALQQIPLTLRDLNESFWVVTAITRDGTLSGDLRFAAQSTATMVVLMGLRRLDEITKIVSEYRSPETPVAVIENGSLPDERVVLGTLTDIAQKTIEEALQPPALVVIGEVVRFHPHFEVS